MISFNRTVNLSNQIGKVVVSGRDGHTVKNGLAIAKITDIKDPKNLGRVKCAYITNDSDSGETGLIYCVTLFGGKENGMFFHPNVGDIVVLGFENGDFECPIVLGSLWIENNTPPLTITQGKHEEYKIITPNKSYIDLYDKEGKEKITISTPKERMLVMDDDQQQIQVTDGKTELLIDSKKGELSITVEKKLTLKVGSSATITIDGTTGDITVDAKKAVDIKTAQYTMKASGTAELTANGQATLKSSGMLTLKGSMTKIN